MVRSLEARALVVPSARGGDGRGSRLLSLSKAGQLAVQEWVRDSSAALSGPTADPIRTRTYSLDVLPAIEQTKKVQEWAASTRSGLDQVRAALERFRSANDVAEARAYRAAELQLEARLCWLEELEREMQN